MFVTGILCVLYHLGFCVFVEFCVFASNCLVMDVELQGQFVRVLNTYGVLFDDVGVFEGVLSPAQVDGLLGSLPFSSQHSVEVLLSLSRFFNDSLFSSVFKPEHVLLLSQSGFISPASMMNAFETILIGFPQVSSSDISGVLANAVLALDFSKDPLSQLKSSLVDFGRFSSGDLIGSSFLSPDSAVALVLFLGGDRARSLRKLVEFLPGSSDRHFNYFLDSLDVSSLDVSLSSSFDKFMISSALRSFSRQEGVRRAISNAFSYGNVSDVARSFPRVLSSLRASAADPSTPLVVHLGEFDEDPWHSYADVSLNLINGVSGRDGNVRFLALEEASSVSFARFFQRTGLDFPDLSLAWSCCAEFFDRSLFYDSVLSFVEFVRSPAGVSLVSSESFSERELVVAFRSRVLVPLRGFMQKNIGEDYYQHTGPVPGSVLKEAGGLFDGFVEELDGFDVSQVGSRGFVKDKFEFLTRRRAPLFGDVEAKLYGVDGIRDSLVSVGSYGRIFNDRFTKEFEKLSVELDSQLERASLVSGELLDVVNLLEGLHADFDRVVAGVGFDELLSVKGVSHPEVSEPVVGVSQTSSVEGPVLESGFVTEFVQVVDPVPVVSVSSVDSKVNFWLEQLDEFKEEYGQMVVDCQGVDSFEGRVEGVLKLLPVLDGSSSAGADLRSKLVSLEDLKDKVEAQRRLVSESVGPVESASRFSKLSKTLFLFESAGLALLEHWALVKNLLANCDLSALSASSGLLASGVPEVASKVELLRKQTALAASSTGPEGLLAQAKASSLLSQILDLLKSTDPVVVTSLDVYDSLCLEIESGVSVRVSDGSVGLSR